MAPPLSHDEFFSSLTTLLSKTTEQAHGSVYLTQKPLPSSESTSSPSILIRASDGNTNAPNPKSANQTGKITKNRSSKVKFSTVVKSEDLDAFYTRYAEVCKTGMSGLKKRDRKRKTKAKGGASKATKA
ncbi:uncharacterized protein N7483_007297 [Penicillium malachiteum]|uniref:uncharacterized protein n=1 Tax=Penicillium malachiteum TaxID=1324776 RepID=UPI002546F3FA|nr:uncharacterized protein N7483_007297 [Penicillium malachiteum]KAJ5725940.1 hypothetical protein N7483_007297 [Penicillium malachiteum]